jgi:Domain of unknown function (DUF4124)
MLESLYRVGLGVVLMACLWTGGAMAQTAPSNRPNTASAATPTPSVSSPTSTTATRRANTGEIYRWIDANGKVQYGADVPEDRKSTARKIDTRGNVVSSRVPASIGSAPQQPAADNEAPIVRQPVTEREKCEAAWKAYNDSQACFAQFRQGTVRGAGNRAGSNVSQEALGNCQSLPEPAACR